MMQRWVRGREVATSTAKQRRADIGPSHSIFIASRCPTASHLPEQPVQPRHPHVRDEQGREAHEVSCDACFLPTNMQRAGEREGGT